MLAAYHSKSNIGVAQSSQRFIKIKYCRPLMKSSKSWDRCLSFTLAWQAAQSLLIIPYLASLQCKVNNCLTPATYQSLALCSVPNFWLRIIGTIVPAHKKVPSNTTSFIGTRYCLKHAWSHSLHTVYCSVWKALYPSNALACSRTFSKNLELAPKGST